jgi:NADH:ubiquinone oxidoreductase subunit F (NADH-binding)/(2Fe-2S) ferredoxin/Pyruvate/2-oxoacid:ferredoxin oxidoreductase delta subunit
MTGISVSDLKQIRDQTESIRNKYKAQLMICTGTGCVANKSFSILEVLEKELKDRNLENDYQIVPTGCMGFCAQGPIMVIFPEGVFYQKLTHKNIPTIVEEHFVNGNPVKEFMYISPVDENKIPLMKDIEFFKKQQLIVLGNRSRINPEKIDDYIGFGGYMSIAKALTEMTPDGVLSEVKRSGIRGRGGGGFPTGAKWESCINAVKKIGLKPYVVCNADEGDPGAFMDRSIIEADPHRVIEGMILGAYAIGSNEGYVYIRREYPLALKRLTKAIDQAREYGLLGKNILGTDFCFDINIHQGAGAFVCGESSALMKAMEGMVGEPRAKYVHSVEVGYKGQPTVLNNVETWANIPWIIENGGEWFAGIGTGDVSDSPWNGSTGTKVFSLVGDVNNSGLVEVPMGITLREIVQDIGGGIPNGGKCKAIQTGGPSGGCIPHDQLDLKVDFDTLTEAGSMMGSGGLIVMDDSKCMVDVAKYFIKFLAEESCGQCTPCREGTLILYQTLKKITDGKGDSGDLELLQDICSTMSSASLCALGAQAPNPVLSTLRNFKAEFETHIRDKKCPAGVCKALINFSINEANCNACFTCVKKCPVNAITGGQKNEKPPSINQDECIKCGMCVEVCNYEAVEKR